MERTVRSSTPTTTPRASKSIASYVSLCGVLIPFPCPLSWPTVSCHTRQNCRIQYPAKVVLATPLNQTARCSSTSILTSKKPGNDSYDRLMKNPYASDSAVVRKNL